ncbi:hypothetical protein CFC21_069912 [Triticum aestivum]|uniref:Uncharacterized protein n=2 Tax=Triticum aestivum TaxID=4565 RepID=A0A9R1HDC0_WHEAT|nr:hypothetical protein CFC21_069912 [Triticum aestivum]
MRGSRSRRRRSVGNGGGLKPRRDVVRLSLPHSTRSISLPHHRLVLQLVRSMSPWKPRLEARVREIANGDNAKLMEIISWFAEERDLKEAAGMAYRRLTEAKDWRLTPTGGPVGALGMLLWAMEELESDDPKLEMKWRAFRSRRRKPAGLTEFVVGAVMGLPVPAPAMVEEKAPEDLVVIATEEGGKPGAKKKKARWPLVIRRSPRFPRRSPRLLSLACHTRE